MLAACSARIRLIAAARLSVIRMRSSCWLVSAAGFTDFQSATGGATVPLYSRWLRSSP